MLLEPGLCFRCSQAIVGITFGLVDDLLEGEGVGWLAEWFIGLARLVAFERRLLSTHGE